MKLVAHESEVVHVGEYTVCGINVNRSRYGLPTTIPYVEQRPVSQILWENVKALMLHVYHEENLNKLAKEAKFSPGTSSRLKEQKTAVRVSTLDKLASAFKPLKLQPWQLLVPDLDPARLPSAKVTKPSKADIERVEMLKKMHAELTPEQRELFVNTEEGQSLLPHFSADRMDASRWSAAAKSPSRKSSSTR